MKELAYKRNLALSVGEGRSGHALKDLFTSVILGVLADVRVVFLESEWAEQNILDNVTFSDFQGGAHDLLDISQRKVWEGVSLGQLNDAVAKIKAAPEGSQIVVGNVFRVHIDQLFLWEERGKIPQGTALACLHRLRSLFHYAPDQNELVFHARRGDVANPGHDQYAKMGPGMWSVQYFQDMINRLADRYQPDRVVVLSEIDGGEDLLDLKGALVELGGDDHVAYHLKRMVSAKWFVPTSSSLSTWAAYLSRNTVIVPDKPIKHFRHRTLLPGWHHSKQ